MRLHDIFRRNRRRTDIDDEIETHIRMSTEDWIERGASPGEARRRALLEFGSVRNAREDAHAVWNWTTVEQLLQDLRSGTRILTRSPGVSLTAIVLIALVIGGNTTIFSAVHGLLSKPAPGVQPEGLVSIGWANDRDTVSPEISHPTYRAIAAESRALQLLAWHDESFTVVHQNGSHSVRGETVSPNYFEVLGVTLSMGRPFEPADDSRHDRGLVAVISDSAWQNYFGGAADIVGQHAMLNGHAATIVGVAPKGFHGAWLAEGSEVWVPMTAYARLEGEMEHLDDRKQLYVHALIGRLLAGTSLDEAQAEIATIAQRSLSAHRDGETRLVPTLFKYTGMAGRDTLFNQRAPRFLAIFSLVTTVTLVIVCANVANLMLARAMTRQREMAVRQSFGASRARIVRIVLAEGLVLSLGAWVAACLFAYWTSALLPGLIPQSEFGNVRIELDLSPDWVVLAYALVLAIAATIVFTLAPAVRTWRLNLLPFLKAGEQGVVGGRSAVSGALVVLQLAFSVLLLTTAALAYRSLSLMDQVDLGFSRENLLLVSVDTGGNAKTGEARVDLLNRMLERLRAVPGVEAASYASYEPSGSWPSSSARVSVTEQPVQVQRNYVGPEFLRAFGIGTLAGSELRRKGSVEGVINQHLAEALWPGETAIGRTFLEGSPERAVTVVGVAPNAYLSGSRRTPRPYFVMLPTEQRSDPFPFSTFHVRYAGSLDSVAPAIGRAFREVDATVPLAHVRTMEAELENITWMTRTLTMLLTVFAAGSLLIASLGQYAAMSFVMRQRVRDFGIRIALGATPRDIASSAVGDGLKLTALGLLVGVALGAAIGRSASSLLYGVTLTDVPTYVAVLGLLGAASLIACYLPARRAARISPVQALRQE